MADLQELDKLQTDLKRMIEERNSFIPPRPNPEKGRPVGAGITRMEISEHGRPFEGGRDALTLMAVTEHGRPFDSSSTLLGFRESRSLRK